MGVYRDGSLFLTGAAGSAPSSVTSTISLNPDKSVAVESATGSSIKLLANGNIDLIGPGFNWMPPNGASSDTIVRVTSGGWLVKQGTSSRRFKTDITPLDVDDRLLDIKPVSFRYTEQKAEFEAGEESWSDTNKDVFENGLPTYRGVIAEELEAMGLNHLVGHDSDGEPYSVAYDQMGFELIPIVARQRDRINRLEARLAALEAAV